MKKVIILILAIVMVFCFVSCGENSDDSYDIASIEGVYEETTEGYAILHCLSSNDGKIIVAIESEPEGKDYNYEEWSMYCVLSGNKLAYQNGYHMISRSATNGVITEEPSDYNTGYFEIKSKNEIVWTGSGHEETSSFIFDKME